MLSSTSLFKLQSPCRNTWRQIYHTHPFLASDAALPSCHLTSEAHPGVREGLSLSCPSQRQLRWSWAVPGHSFLSLSTPDLGAAQPGHRRLVQGFDLSCTYCKKQRLLEISHTVNHQVIKQHFCSNLVEQLDKLRECNFSHFKWQQLIALLYPRCFSLSHLL